MPSSKRVAVTLSLKLWPQKCFLSIECIVMGIIRAWLLHLYINFNNLMMQRWLCHRTETRIVSETLQKKVPVLLSVQRISWQYLIPAFPWLTVHCHIQPGNKEMLVHWCIQPRCNKSTMSAMFICFQRPQAENTSQLHFCLYSAILPQPTHGGVSFDFYEQLRIGKILTEFCR